MGYTHIVEFYNYHEATVHLWRRTESAYKTGPTTSLQICESRDRIVTCVWELLLVKGVTDGAVGEVKGKAGWRRVWNKSSYKKKRGSKTMFDTVC